MTQTTDLNSRRAFLKFSALSLGVLGAGASSSATESLEPVSIAPEDPTQNNRHPRFRFGLQIANSVLLLARQFNGNWHLHLLLPTRSN